MGPAQSTFFCDLWTGIEGASISQISSHTRGMNSAATRGLITFLRPLGEIFHYQGFNTKGNDLLWADLVSPRCRFGQKRKKKEWNFKSQGPQIIEGTDLMSPIFHLCTHSSACLSFLNSAPRACVICITAMSPPIHQEAVKSLGWALCCVKPYNP